MLAYMEVRTQIDENGGPVPRKGGIGVTTIKVPEHLFKSLEVESRTEPVRSLVEVYDAENICVDGVLVNRLPKYAEDGPTQVVKGRGDVRR